MTILPGVTEVKPHCPALQLPFCTAAYFLPKRTPGSCFRPTVPHKAVCLCFWVEVPAKISCKDKRLQCRMVRLCHGHARLGGIVVKGQTLSPAAVGELLVSIAYCWFPSPWLGFKSTFSGAALKLEAAALQSLKCFVSGLKVLVCFFPSLFCVRLS